MEFQHLPVEKVIDVASSQGGTSDVSPLRLAGAPAPAAVEASGGGAPRDERALPTRTNTHGLRLTFEHVCYSVTAPLTCKLPEAGSKKDLLRGVTGEFVPGEMCAILGPSGSGKTTFLDILAGRKNQGQLTGTILYGASKPSRQLLRRYVGYVEQQDTLVDTMTVFEMLMYTAELKRPLSETRATKLAAVESLISKLALESCRNTRIGSALHRGISGGQAKRTNIALALITDARVLLMDEPTSGLDSFTANEVMSVVKTLCKDGTTIATTIHSPSSFCFGLFDRTLVLLGGRTVYFGPTGQPMIDYFVSQLGAREPLVGDNLAEWLMDFAITQERIPGGGDALADGYEQSHLAKMTAMQVSDTIWRERERMSRSLSLRNVHESSVARAADGGFMERITGSSSYVTPSWWTFKTLLQHRTVRNYRTLSYVAPRMFDKVAFALLLLALYWGIGKDFSIGNIPNVGALIYLCMSHSMYAGTSYVSAIMLDRALYVREQNDGMYRPTVYLLWKIIDELILQMVVSVPVNAMIFYACAMQGSFLYFHLCLSSMILNALAIAYTISNISPAIDFATSLTTSLITVMAMLSGFLIRERAVPVIFKWCVKINLMHYMWGGLMINQFEGAKGGSIGGAKVLDYYDLSGRSKWYFFGLTLCGAAIWSFLAWLALVVVKQHRR